MGLHTYGFVEGVSAISGERCNPHPHVVAGRGPRADQLDRRAR